MALDTDGNNYVYDIHGSVTSIVNSGTKSKEYEYNAFGKKESETNKNTSNPWQYCGEYYDSDSGLIYLRNRYYDCETGSFINEDPARSGINWYSYCNGNPVMFCDPLGLKGVMGSYIAEKNGGSAKSTYDSATGKVVSTTITINGITKTYTIGKKDSVASVENNRVIIDNTILQNDFGLSESQSLHNPGDYFNSPDDAAYAFGLMYNTESTTRSEQYPNGREYIAYIYVEYGRKTDKYYYGSVSVGDENRTALPKKEEGKNLYAWVHTHGAYRSNADIESDYFSGSFRGGGDGQVTQKLGIDAYLVTPSGVLKRLDHTGDISSTVMIFDSNPNIRVIADGIPHN